MNIVYIVDDGNECDFSHARTYCVVFFARGMCFINDSILFINS